MARLPYNIGRGLVLLGGLIIWGALLILFWRVGVAVWAVLSREDRLLAGLLGTMAVGFAIGAAGVPLIFHRWRVR